MDNQAKIDAILRMTRKNLEAYFANEASTTDPIAYENELLELGRTFSREVLSKAVGELPKSRNSKKSPHETRSGLLTEVSCSMP